MANKFEEEREAIIRLDGIDDAMWGVLVDLNKHFEIGVKFDEIERSELNVEAREALMGVLKIFR